PLSPNSAVTLAGAIAMFTETAVTGIAALSLHDALPIYNGPGLVLNATTGPWTLAGGTINGGTVTIAAGTALLGTNLGGALVNVRTLDGTPELPAHKNTDLTVSRGLTLVSGSVIQIGGSD